MAASARTAEKPENPDLLETQGKTAPADQEAAIEPDFVPDPSEPHWIEVRLVDAVDEPVRGMPVLIELPNGMFGRVTTNQDGVARLDGIPEGSCKVTFPELDKEAWEDA